MKQLRFNSAAITSDYIKAISHCCDDLLAEYYEEIRFQMKSLSGADDLDAKSLDDVEIGLLQRQVIGGAWAIMDSFGTGSLMDKSNPFLAEYMGSSLFNPMRSGYAISGRPAGNYTNLFGETAESSGKMAGLNIEERIPPRTPSKAFQQAWEWFQSGNRIQKKLDITTLDFFKKVRGNPAIYFSYG